MGSGMITGNIKSSLNINHSLYRLVPIDVYAEEHPEYFGLWDGTRRNDYLHTHYCLTNPELVPIVVEGVLEDIKHHPELRNFSVSQNDTIWQYCQCDECMAVDEREASHMGALLEFVNAVADEIGKTHPDVYVGTLSYGFSRKPPKTIRPRANVEINLCSIEACQIHTFDDPDCPRNVAFMSDLYGWSEICDQLFAWSYNVNFHDPFLPYPNLYTFKPNIRTFLDAGVRGAFFQCGSMTGAMADLRHYLISRLMWNPIQSTDQVIDEFLDLHYGQAAPPIRRFIDLVHDHYGRSGIHNASCIYNNWELPVDDAVAREGLALFGEAMKLAEDETVRARVEKASICAYRAALNPVWRLDEGVDVDPWLAEQMRPLAEQFFSLCDRHGAAAEAQRHRERLGKLLAIRD